MSRPWMPLFCETFLVKTDHLGAIETGAYLCLIMSYWIKRKLPTDDKSLARIARLTQEEWLEHRKSIACFFNEDWSHNRIEEELRKSDEAYEKRANAGSKGGKHPKKRIAEAESKQCLSNAVSAEEAGPNLTLTHSPSNEGDSVLRTGGDPPTPEKQLFDRAKQIHGPKVGGQVAKLLKLHNGNIALARADIERSSTMSSPAEWLAGLIRAGPRNGHSTRTRSPTVADVYRQKLDETPDDPEPRHRTTEAADPADPSRDGYAGRLSHQDAHAARRNALVDC